MIPQPAGMLSSCLRRPWFHDVKETEKQKPGQQVTQVYPRIDERNPLPRDLIDHYVSGVLALTLPFHYRRGGHSDRDRAQRSCQSQPSQGSWEQDADPLAAPSQSKAAAADPQLPGPGRSNPGAEETSLLPKPTSSFLLRPADHSSPDERGRIPSISSSSSGSSTGEEMR